MLSLFRRLARDVSGATAIEYTLIASLIAVAAIASMRSVGNTFQHIGILSLEFHVDKLSRPLL